MHGSRIVTMIMIIYLLIRPLHLSVPYTIWLPLHFIGYYLLTFCSMSRHL